MHWRFPLRCVPVRGQREDAGPDKEQLVPQPLSDCAGHWYSPAAAHAHGRARHLCCGAMATTTASFESGHQDMVSRAGPAVRRPRLQCCCRVSVQPRSSACAGARRAAGLLRPPAGHLLVRPHHQGALLRAYQRGSSSLSLPPASCCCWCTGGLSEGAENICTK